MPANIGALMSRPSTPSPPDDDPSLSGRDQAAGGAIQSLMQGGKPDVPQGGMPAPTHEQTVAALRHLAMFQKEFGKILSLPDVGKVDIKGPVLEMMADVMGDGLVTLPQVMNQLKNFPMEPLQQRQWVEQHLANAQQAAQAILQQHAMSKGPLGPWEIENAARGGSSDHIAMMSGLVNQYKAHRSKKVRR